MTTLLDLVRHYYAACNAGRADAIAACFVPDAEHYYQRMAPHVGAEAISRHFAGQAHELGGRWTVENGVEDADQAVVEWTMTWRHSATGEPRLDRGTDWFRFDGDLITEVRCYHHSSPTNRSGNLIGFDHRGRGFTMLEDVSDE